MQALVKLDHSSRTFPEQLEEACRLIGLNDSSGLKSSSDSHHDGDDEVPAPPSTFRGREEWVLRWLLGKLQKSEISALSAAWDPNSWLLLRYLLTKLTLTNAARLLKAHDFLSILDKTLNEIVLSIATQHEKDVGSYGPAGDNEGSGSSAASASTESSSTIVESLVTQPMKISRKRKRPGSELQLLKQSVPLLEQQGVPGNVFFSISGFLNCIVKFTSHSASESSAIPREYMKSVLRSNPERAARILGNSISLASFVVTQDNGHSRLSYPGLNGSSLTPFIEIWNDRTIVAGDSDGKASNEAFMSHCLLPAAILISKCRRIPGNQSNLEEIKQLLEHLVARHALRAIRTASLASSGGYAQRTSSSFQSSQYPLLDEALRPIQAAFAQFADKADISLFDRTTLDNLVTTLAVLFDVAVRCSPRLGPKQRLNEAPWLEALFLKLADIAGLIASLGIATESPDYLTIILGDLLHIVTIKGVSLSTSALKDIVRRFSGLTTPADGIVRWILVATVLQIDADVFITSVGQQSNRGKSIDTEDPLLPLLLTKISIHGVKKSSKFNPETPWSYMYIRFHVVPNLLRGFAHARDLIGFLEYWGNQIQILDKARLAKPPYMRRSFSIWEDEEIHSVLRECFEASLTSRQISTYWNSICKDIKLKVKSGSETPIQDLPGVTAACILVDAVLGAIYRDETRDLLQEDIKPFYLRVTALLRLSPMWGMAIDRTWPFQHWWRLHRILARLLEHFGPLCVPASAPGYSGDRDSEIIDQIQAGLRVAKKRFWRGTTKHSADPSKSERQSEAIEAFHFVSSMVLNIPETHVLGMYALEKLEEMIGRVADFFEDTASRIRGSGGVFCLQWNGRPGEIYSAGVLAVAFGVMLLKSPKILQHVSSGVRQKMLQNLYQAAYCQEAVWKKDESQMMLVRIWEGLLDNQFCQDNADVMKSVLMLDFQHDGVLSDLAVRAYLRLPLGVLRRQHRENILDSLVHNFSDLRSHLDSSAALRHISLMVKLMEIPNATSQLATNPLTIWEMASAIHHANPSHDNSIFACFAKLVELTLGHIISTIDQDRCERFLQKLWNDLKSYIDTVESTWKAYGTTLLVKAALSTFWLHRGSVTMVANVLEIQEVREAYLSHLLASVALSKNDEWGPATIESRANLIIILDAIAAFLDLINNTDNSVKATMDGIQEEVYQRALSAMELEPTYDLFQWDTSVKISIYKILGCLQKTRDDVFLHQNTGSFLLMHDLSIAEEVSVLQSYSDCVIAQDTGIVNDLISSIGRDTSGIPLTRSSLMFLGRLLSLTDGSKEPRDETRSVVSNVFGTLCMDMVNAEKFSQFHVFIDCIEFILQKRAWAVSQWNIDNVLNAIIICSSACGPDIRDTAPGPMFQRLCGLFGSILALHRTKLGGRFHLVVPLLQNLLRCLFESDARGQHQSDRPSLPPWFPTLGPYRRFTLEENEASSYARLLTNLCDPTVSSVTNPHARLKSNLSDETKKARAIAGQYLPYVLMEYTKCQLRSRMLPEVKTALTPGLYAVLDVMAPSTMRTLNESMDSSSRAIFKALYDDHRRFGMWKEV